MMERNENAGWKLVPVEPTSKMVSEGSCAQSLPGPHYISESAARQCWKHMLAAAPQQPAPQPLTDERAAFEAWAQTQGTPEEGWWFRQLPDGGYSAGKPDIAWNAWRAASHTCGNAIESLLLERSERRVAEAQVEELLAALQGVVAVADRATVEFDRARQAIASAVKNRTIGRAVVSENPVSE